MDEGKVETIKNKTREEDKGKGKEGAEKRELENFKSRKKIILGREGKGRTTHTYTNKNSKIEGKKK